MLTETGFVDVHIGPPVDTFGGAQGEANARTFEVHGHAFLAHKPWRHGGGDCLEVTLE